MKSRDQKDFPDLQIIFDRFMKYVPIANIRFGLFLTAFHIRDMSKVKDGLQSLSERSSLGRAFQADEISGQLEGYVQTITWHISDLQVHIFRSALAIKMSSWLGWHRFPSICAYTLP